MIKTLSLADITSYREESIKCGKSEDYITALSDLIDIIEQKAISKATSIKKLKRSTSPAGEMVMVYHYSRNIDNSITKRAYKAISKKNSYEVKDCWRSRLSKTYDINKFEDCLHHDMWTDEENDALMEEILERYNSLIS